jgi:hypothetical protein
MLQTGSLVGLICTFWIWRLRRVSDDKFLLQGSHRKSSVSPVAPVIDVIIPGGVDVVSGPDDKRHK